MTDLLQTDASYKVTWQGYPILLVGTSDKNKVFHPFALAVSKNERTEDFEFIFRAVEMFSNDWKPEVLLADASEAITAAFEKVFGAPRVRIMCYFHVTENVEKFLRPLSNQKTINQIKSDMQALQNEQRRDIFDVASALFLQKWRKEQPDFTAYFEKEWLQKNSEWFEDAACGYPSTNNGLEGTNSWIKTEHTLRDRLPYASWPVFE